MTNESTKQTPTHEAFQVKDREGSKGFWTKIGAAWAHKDQKGFTIHLDAVPLDGRISLRVVGEKKN